MSIFDGLQDRNIVPRWRTVARSVALNEAAPVSARADREVAVQNYRFCAVSALERAEKLFAENQSFPYAAEVVAEAILAGEPKRGFRAAKFMEAEGSGNLPIVRNLLDEGLLGRARHMVGTVASVALNDGSTAKEGPRSIINRFRTGNQYRRGSGVAWLDLALAHTSLGNIERAERALMVARRLMGPENRLLLRAEARFFHHIGKLDQALWYLRNSGVLDVDPWIMSVEVGLSTLAEDKSRIISKARRQVTDRVFGRFAGSELTAAIGTLELIYGAHKKSRKYFKQANVDPAEQALAQTLWARTVDNQIDTPAENLLKRSPEARARRHMEQSQWRSALNAVDDWQEDEPFASGPALYAAGLLLNVYDQPQKALERIEPAVRANANNNKLLNTGAYAAILSGDIGRGKVWLKQVDLKRSTSPNIDAVYATATQGLLKYAEGDLSGGRACYHESRLHARKHNLNELLVTNALFHLHSALIYGDADTIEDKEVIDLAFKPTRSNELAPFRDRLGIRLAKEAQRAPKLERILKGVVRRIKNRRTLHDQKPPALAPTTYEIDLSELEQPTVRGDKVQISNDKRPVVRIIQRQIPDSHGADE